MGTNDQTTGKKNMTTSEEAIKNRKAWDAYGDEYNKLHNEQLDRSDFYWGYWSIPEREVLALGNIKEKKVLELGGGAAFQSIAIKRQGGILVAIDNSLKMLEYAKKNQVKYKTEFHLIHCCGEHLNLESDQFDIVFCDHGAMTFSKTKETLFEVNRVLKKGGTFAFNIGSPLQEVCYDTKNEVVDNKFHKSYFELEGFEEDGFIYQQHTLSGWIKLFIEAGFQIVDLVELRPNEQSKSTYGRNSKLFEWALNWPAENLWKLKKL